MSSPTTDPHSLAQLRLQVLSRFESGTVELPVLPTTATEVIAVCDGEDADARKLAALVQRDQALAAAVLRVANSVLYAAREPIVSLTQAIARLGFRVVCDVSVAVSVKGRVFRVGGQERRIEQMWSRAAWAGGWAREIARLRRHNVEGAFLCGLLHDIGEPIVLQLTQEAFQRAGQEFDADAYEAWSQELHARVGSEVLKRWKLPIWVADCALHHHDPDAAGEHADLARTTLLADLLAMTCREPDTLAEAALAGHPVLADLSLYSDDFRELLARRDAVAAFADCLA